mmetsp:Transcript_66434/g.205812  ORF Transcript_66434/g.205812 Transcript_66434/m.205812 type:complete len:253 (-) Transcript_66434:215-973(-)
MTSETCLATGPASVTARGACCKSSPAAAVAPPVIHASCIASPAALGPTVASGVVSWKASVSMRSDSRSNASYCCSTRAVRYSVGWLLTASAVMRACVASCVGWPTAGRAGPGHSAICALGSQGSFTTSCRCNVPPAAGVMPLAIGGLRTASRVAGWACPATASVSLTARGTSFMLSPATAIVSLVVGACCTGSSAALALSAASGVTSWKNSVCMSSDSRFCASCSRYARADRYSEGSFAFSAAFALVGGFPW